MAFRTKTAVTLAESLERVGATIKRSSTISDEKGTTTPSKRLKTCADLLSVVVLNNSSQTEPRGSTEVGRDEQVQSSEGDNEEEKATAAPDGKEESSEHAEKDREASLTEQCTIDSIDYIKEQKRLVAAEDEAINEKRRQIHSKHASLLGVYTYGLRQISKLTDLRDAPDAILPGNF